MISIIKKVINNKSHYYLHHTKRDKDKFKSLNKYIGVAIPKNIDDLKIDFFIAINKDKFNKINNILVKNNKENKKIPLSIKQKNLEIFAINFTYNTNRIEGSTLGLKDSFNLLQEGITPEKKPLRDIRETEAHQKLFLELFKDKQTISYSNILYWHNRLFKETKKDIAGKIRDYQVAISQSKYTPPSYLDLNIALDDFFKWYRLNKDKYNPIILSALVHLKFVEIHPFGDGNGRMSRLLMNLVLFNNNFPLYIIDYKDRLSYYNALEKSHLRKDIVPFLSWFFKNYYKFISK